MKDKISIFTGMYAPQGIIVMSAIFATLAIPMIPSSPVFFGVLSLLCLGVMFTTQGFELDPRQKTYTSYLKTFGIRHSNNSDSYRTAHYLYMNAANYKHNVSSRVSTTSVRTRLYLGFMLVDDDEPVDIMRSKKRAVVLDKLKLLGDFLKLEVIENDN